MELRVSCRGKAGRLHLQGRSLTLTSGLGFKVIIDETIRGTTPAMSIAGNTLQWKAFTMEFDDADSAHARRFVDAVDALRGVASGDAPNVAASPASSANVSPQSKADARAVKVASRVEGFATLVMVLGVLGGVITAFQTSESCNAYTCDTTHPYIGLGIGVAIATTLQCSVVIMLAVYIQARAARAMG